MTSFCAVLSVDAIDMSGKHEVDLDTTIWKVCSALPELMVFAGLLFQSLLLFLFSILSLLT